MARDYCNELCSKPATGQCNNCDALDASDAFWQRIGLGMFEGWVGYFAHSIAAEGGYRISIGIVATLVGTYFGLCAIMEAKHERHLNRALFERSAFMTMDVAGPSGFKSAMNQFAQLQDVTAPIELSCHNPLGSGLVNISRI